MPCFKTASQAAIYQELTAEVGRLGYDSGALIEDFQFSDWFSRNRVVRTASAVAFGRWPHTYDSACFSILISGSKIGQSLVHDYRAIGAPLAFEVGSEAVSVWRVGTTIASITKVACFNRNELKKIRSYQGEWKPEALLRAKNIGNETRPIQTDFVDHGLIPALESEICAKLDTFFREVLAAAHNTYQGKHRRQPDVRELFRLVFRFLAAKILHDRGVHGFKTLDQNTPAAEILQRVNRHYKDGEAVLGDIATQQVVAEVLWRQIDFRNLSVEILAYVYENTLITPDQRDIYGIHSTPHSVARYIVGRIPFSRFAEEKRIVAEPCSGHGIFLVAALQRLRELSTELDPQKRHEYFTRMLHGIEQDSFAHEVSKISLMLADFPNPNGWDIVNGDVFASPSFDRTLREARVVLANPPFENFSEREREQYAKVSSYHKPIALLSRAIESLPEGGSLGFVLPQQFIDGKKYTAVRQKIAEHFTEIEIVALPDRIFTHSLIESAIVIANGKRVSASSTVQVSFSTVSDADRNNFLKFHRVTTRAVARILTTDFSDSGRLRPLHDVWLRLSSFRRLSDIADVHRGVEWEAPFDEAKYISDQSKPGYFPGYHKAQGNSRPYFAPKRVFLATHDSWRLYDAFSLPWAKPKVLVNAVRSSRGPLRLVAFPEPKNRMATANFVSIWPKEQSGLTANALAAILNSSVANAFVASSSPGKHNPIYVLERIPIPDLSSAEIFELDQATGDYIAQDDELHLSDMSNETKSEKILKEINKLVLRAYRLNGTSLRKLEAFMATVDYDNPATDAPSEDNALESVESLIKSGVRVPSVEPLIKYFKTHAGIEKVLIPLVERIAAKLGFGVEITVEIFFSKESDDSSLCVNVRQSDYPDDFVRQLDRIWDTEVGAKLERLGSGWVTLTTDFGKPTETL